MFDDVSGCCWIVVDVGCLWMLMDAYGRLSDQGVFLATLQH